MPIYDIEEEDIEVISNCPLCDSNGIEVISEVCEKDKKKFYRNYTKRRKYYLFLNSVL